MKSTSDYRSDIDRAMNSILELASTKPALLSGSCIFVEAFLSGAEALGELLLCQPLPGSYSSFRQTSDRPALSFVGEYLQSKGLKVAIVPISTQSSEVEADIRNELIHYFEKYIEWRKNNST